jgi:hypothetical protein
MTTQYRPGDAQLVVLQPRHLSGQVLPISVDSVVLGRNRDRRFSLDDPHVSRTHAVIRRAGGQVLIEDLGSSGSTSINGTPIAQASSLHDGDLITLATVQLRYETADQDHQATFVAVPPPPHHTDPAPSVRYHLGDQHAGVVSNVGHDQYNAYVMQRQSFLAEVAAAKTKASVLAWLGFALFVAGAATWGAVVVRFIKTIPETGTDTGTEDIHFLGPEVLGVPLGVIALGTAGLGATLLIIGIVRHITASSRRRRLEREMPLYFPPTRH